MERRRIINIVRDVIIPSQQEILSPILQSTSFTLSMDASTDITQNKAFNIGIRYFNDSAGRIIESLWGLDKVYDGDENQQANATTIFEKHQKSLESGNIPLKNIDAFCSDQANVIIGSITQMPKTY